MYYILCPNELPVLDKLTIRDMFLPADCEGNDDFDNGFDICRNDDRSVHQHAKRVDDDMAQGLCCFRSLRHNPSAMITVPHAPRIKDSEAFTAVLEHLVIGANKSYRITMEETEVDINDRTIIVTPSTFTYQSLRGMRRGVVDNTIIYELGDAEHTSGIEPRVVDAVLKGILVTQSDPARRYIVTTSTKGEDVQIELLKRWRSAGFVDMVEALETGETHWRITDFGSSQVRMSYELKELVQVHDPLLETVWCCRE